MCPPLERTGKHEPYYVAHNIKKYYGKMSLVFPENSKNCQNHGLIEAGVMGRPRYQTRCVTKSVYHLCTGYNCNFFYENGSQLQFSPG